MDAPSILHDFFVSVSDRRGELNGSNWQAIGQGAATMTTGPIAPIKDRRHLAAPFTKTPGRWKRHEALALALAPSLPAATLDAAARGDRALSLVEKLSALLRHAALPLRWEPMNMIAQHRGVPSPGALFPIDVYILVRTGDHCRTLLCSPHDLCLLEVGRSPIAADALPADTARIVIVGSLSRCIDTYGDFGIILTALEAGMLHMQVRLLSRHLGLTAVGVSDIASATSGTPIDLGHWSDVALACVDLSDDAMAEAFSRMPEARVTTAMPRKTVERMDTHPALRAFIGALTIETVGDATTPATRGAARPDAATFPLFRATERRSSGLGSGVAAWPGQWPRSDLLELLADVHRLYRSGRAAGLPDIPLHVSIALRETASAPMTLHRFCTRTGSLDDVAANDSMLAAAARMCATNIAMLVTIGIDDRMLASARSARIIVDPHVAAGGLAQCFCLASAEHGATARPHKANPDKLVNMLMPLDQRALLQILVARDGRPNPTFPIE